MGHLNIVLLLLQNGASPDVTNIVSMAWVRITTGRKDETFRVGVCGPACVSSELREGPLKQHFVT